jgi:flagellar protein FlaI
MSEGTDNIIASDLEVDSRIRGLELCVDDDGNWTVRHSSGYFLTKDGELVEAEDDEVPTEAVYSSVIKAQGYAQDYADELPEEQSAEQSSSQDSGESVEKESAEDESEQLEESQSEDGKFGEDSVLFVDDNVEEDEKEDFDTVFEKSASDEVDRNGTEDEQEEEEQESSGLFGSEESSQDISEEFVEGETQMTDSDVGSIDMEDDSGIIDRLYNVLGIGEEDSDENDIEGESEDKKENEMVEGRKAVDSTESEEQNEGEEKEEVDELSVEEDMTEDDAEVEEQDEDEMAEDEKVEVDTEDEDGIMNPIYEMLGMDSDEDKEDGLSEATKNFFGADMAEIDRTRPDAQNVSVGFVDWEQMSWSDSMQKFWDKLRGAEGGDESLEKDLKTDLWERYTALVRTNEYARGDIIDLSIMFLLMSVGITVLSMGAVTSLTGNVSAYESLAQISSYGDVIVIVTMLLSLVSVAFWLSRRTNKKTIVTAIRKPTRIAMVSTIFILLFGSMYIGYILILGGGQEALAELEQAFFGWFESNRNFTLLTIAIGEMAYNFVSQFRGTSNTVFGLSMIEASILMVFMSMLSAYPVLKRTIARFILTVNMGPREFREETGILIEQIREEGDEEYDGPRYMMGRGGEAAEEPGAEDGEVVTKEEAFEDIELDEEDETEALLTLPSNIRGSPYKNYEEVRRYWVRAPYAYVSIVYNERQNDYRYVVVEPELDESEKVIFDELNERLDTVLLFEDVEEKEDHEEEQQLKLEKLEKRMLELSEEYDITINDETFHRLMYYVERNYVYYSKIDPLINDPNVEDISCDGEGQYIFVFHSDYKDVMTNVRFEREELRSFIQELAQRSGEHISAADPMVDASLPDGSRAQMTLGTEVTTHGSTFTIRLFEEIPFTPVDLLGYDTFSNTQMAYLWTAIEHNKSLIFAGGTASGKTTSMNAVSRFIPPKAKVITIEDTREISLPQKNWIPGTTREGVGGEEGGDDIDMYELLRAALRQRPEYIVVGEIRGREAETLFQAMNTGHTTYSTMHAETVDAAIGRLTNPPINVPKQMITALDIICIQNQIRFTDEDGNAVNVRRNEETREIVSLRDNGQFENRRPFQWDAETDTFIQSLEDSHVLARIADENGWTPEDKRRELKQREEVLEYMVEENIREFEYVTNIIQAYMVDPDKIIKEVKNDTLEPSELKSLTDLEWDEDEQKDPELNQELESGTDDETPEIAQEAGDDT